MVILLFKMSIHLNKIKMKQIIKLKNELNKIQRKKKKFLIKMNYYINLTIIKENILIFLIKI